MNNNIEKKESDYAVDKKYYTQEEVAVLFRVSQSTIKNWRDRGLLEYLQPTGSTRVLYPRESVEEFESQHIKRAKVIEFKRPEQVKREEPGLSSNRIKKEWRITLVQKRILKFIENVLLMGDCFCANRNKIPRKQEDGDHGTLCKPFQSTGCSFQQTKVLSTGEESSSRTLM